MQKVIAIDGPSGAGKSTVAKMVAAQMQAVYIDTGAMFRIVGLFFHKENIEFVENDLLKQGLARLESCFEYAPDPKRLVVVNGEDWSQEIREHHVSDLASRVSKLPLVRTFLLDFQRSLVQEKMAVMEGRDIGTVVFPEAFCKIFLTASPEVRAERRVAELKARGDDLADYGSILQDIKERDDRDSSRDTAPLKKADDAVAVDTSALNIDEVVGVICKEARARYAHIN